MQILPHFYMRPGRLWIQVTMDGSGTNPQQRLKDDHVVLLMIRREVKWSVQ